MCTYTTAVLDSSAGAKGPNGWFTADRVTVYYDHPVHFSSGHALMIDVMTSRDVSSRVALELDPHEARALADAILRTLDGVESLHSST
jgi:hypothetical protein